MEKKIENYEDIEDDDGDELPDYENNDYEYDDDDMDCSWLDREDDDA